jgi:hypothetical protein
VKISCGGSPPKEGRLWVDPSFIPWSIVKDIASLERVFSRLRFLEGGLFCLVSSSR